MIPSVRLLALIALVTLSIWLGYLLGKANVPKQSDSERELPAATLPAPLATTPTTTLPEHPQVRVDRLRARINQLAEQTDDRVINRERAQILAELARELAGPDADLFADSISYYNQTIPRDGAGLLLESAWLKSDKRWQAAMEPLITAAEFPETNEQFEHIRTEQALLLEAIVAEFAATEDWPGLIDYLNNLLLQDPINDRIRLALAQAQANNSELDAAMETLAITGTEGVAQQEIDNLRESLRQTNAEPIQFRDEGGALIARATLNSSPIELLVDTGATKTALSTRTLRQLGAYPLNESTQVMTAAGRIRAQLYRVPELVVEQQRFSNRTVLALDNPPARWDGLLGMDLLRDMNVDLSGQLAADR